MKPYGVPRCANYNAHPDLYEIAMYGFKSSQSRTVNKKNGHIKNSFHSSTLKRHTRIKWKKRARAKAKRIIRHEIDDFF